MKKKVLSLLLALLIILGSIPMTLLSAAAEEISNISDGGSGGGDTQKPVVSIEPADVYSQKDELGYRIAKPDASGNVYFNIKVTGIITEDITVYYATEDRSAIAAAGDYEAKSGSVVLTKKDYENQNSEESGEQNQKTTTVQISVKTTRAEYSIIIDNAYVSRNFKVKLTGVSENAVIDAYANEAKCSLQSEHLLYAVVDGKNAVLEPYSGIGGYRISNFLKTGTCDSGKTITQTSALSFPASWAADYIDGGIDAKLYASLQDAHIEESWNNSSTGVTVEFLGITIKVKGEFDDNNEFGWGPAFLYALNGVQGQDSKFLHYYDENFVSLQWRSFAGYGSISKNELKSNLPACLNSKVVIRRSLYVPSSGSSNEPAEFFIALSDDVLKKNQVELKLTSHGGYSRQLTGGTLHFRLEDITAPRIENKTDGSYAIYHNFDTVTEGEKLRVAIRYNEPVQVKNNWPYFMGKVNGQGSGNDGDSYTIKFNYVGGSGTDTLYFEADYQGKYQINSITDIKFVYGDCIKDYAGVANSFAPNSDIFISGFNLDRRVPVISIQHKDSKDDESKPWVRERDVVVTVTNVSEQATLYYSWLTNGDEVSPLDIYESSIALSNISVNGTQVVPIPSDGDEAKYLYIKVVSKYGQAQTSITVSDAPAGTPKSRNCLGPYNLDKTAPTVDESKLLPKSREEGSTPTEKLYSIPAPTDAGVGGIILKAYYVGEKGEEKLWAEVSEWKDGNDVALKLTTETVGVGDNVRREVTVFFTLEDSLGNIDEDVARHTVTFDTRDFIDIDYIGPDTEFKSKTEILNDGYTMIYTGDVNSNENGVFYAFVFRGIHDNDREDPDQNIFVVPYVKITRNGEMLQNGCAYYPAENEEYGRYITVVFNEPIAEGYYDIQLEFYVTKDGVPSVSPDAVSETYRIYFGTGKGKVDQLIGNGTVLANKVYQIPASTYFYYMDTNGVVKSETYSGTRLPASFSTREKALEYVMFNEYRDLYAITLTEELANELNAGTSASQKAMGEKREAKAGDVWIRYKSPNWDAGRSHDRSDWVFYYYGSYEELVSSRFSSLLTETIKTISERIVARGKSVALTDSSLMGETTVNPLLDKQGAPYLDPSQMFKESKKISEQSTNSTFIKEITYTGDTAIYSSNIIVNGIDSYVLIGNATIPTSTRLQYKRIDVNGKESNQWIELEYTEGQRFRDVLEGSGRYKIRELGEGGVSEYKVYVDGEAPKVRISWRDKDGEIKSQTISSAYEKEFRARSLKIEEIASSEYDKYSYIALYNSSKELYAVYWMTDLQKATVDIPDGNYYMVVADRSGNSYTMKLYINSSMLNCDIKEVENVKIKFTCDRKAAQIQDFYVKRNGVLVEGKYSPEMEFTDSGTYEFYVKDIYGNVFGPEVYVFTRVYPEVTWKYLDEETGFYVSYSPDSKTKQFSLEKIGDGSYVISTSTLLKFQLDSKYNIEFLGIDPGHTDPDKTIDRTVAITNTQAFKLKVYYRNYPEVYTIYNCTVDTVAPLIDVSVKGSLAMPNEIGELRDAIAAGTVVKDGNKLIPSSISCSSIEKESRYIMNNDVILSDFIKVEINDETGVSSVQVYLNGKLIKEQTGNDDIVLEKAGQYKIVAEDALGNTSEFCFTNGAPDSFTYVVDGLPMLVGLHDFDKFDEHGNYTDPSFGNESVVFVIGENMKIFYMITGDDGAKHFVAFDIKDKAIREVYYCLDSENNLILETSDTVLFDGSAKETVENREYIIYEIREIGLKIYARVTNNGDVVLSIFTVDVPSVTVDARLNTEDEEFYYYTKTVLSTVSPSIIIKTDKNAKPLEFTDNKDVIKFNKAFSILTDNFEACKISFVEVYYSNKNDFADMGYWGKDEIYSAGAYYNKEGFYFVRLVNQYGNESTFIVHLSNRFDVTSYSEFADGTKNHYSADYSGTLYSNNKIVFELYSDNATVKVKKDGVDYRPVITVNNGITYVILSESGKYTVSLSDAHNNTVERSAEIDSSSVTFNEKLLTGYNENALKKNEGYTNQKLSVNKAVFDREKICYMSVQYGDNVTVIYDSISESGAALDESKLFELIGNEGDGEYVLQVRNRYGAVLTKVIHYRSTPTLTLERVIRSSINPEAYDISKALSIGFWSNSELIFKTEAEHYVFTVNNDKTECPKILAFANADQQGRSEYEITYIDEYGFSYSFKAYLVRQNLEISPELTDGGIDINGVITSAKDIAVKFSENARCTYTVNNSQEKVYTPGEKLSLDGIHRFTVVDHAGNAAALTVKKDTTVEFEFVESNTMTALQCGEVVNTPKVEFKVVNGDSAYIEKVFKNGVLQNNFNSARFSEDGKWEFIISDKLGNKSYFCFYIVTKQKSSFAYTTPYEYQVTELWYDSGDGVKISYLKFVNQNETSSSFEFSENGRYTVVMASSVTGSVSKFEFTINTNSPEVYLVGCNPGETTLNDVTIAGCVIGDTVRVYRATSTGEKLVSEIEVTSLATKMPDINEGGEYRIVVASEAGVETELSFVRKHVMNIEGSIFIMILIAVAVVGLFVGLVYRNKSKTDK